MFRFDCASVEYCYLHTSRHRGHFAQTVACVLRRQCVVHDRPLIHREFCGLDIALRDLLAVRLTEVRVEAHQRCSVIVAIYFSSLSPLSLHLPFGAHHSLAVQVSVICLYVLEVISPIVGQNNTR